MAAASFGNLRSTTVIVATLLLSTPPVAATAKEAPSAVKEAIARSDEVTDLADAVMDAFGLTGKWVWEPALKKEVERHLTGLAQHNWRLKEDGGTIVIYGNPLPNPPRSGLRHELALKFEDHADHATVKQWQRRNGRTIFTVNNYYGINGSLVHLLRVERPLRSKQGRSVVHNQRRHTSNPGWRPWRGKVKREFVPPRLSE